MLLGVDSNFNFLLLAALHIDQNNYFPHQIDFKLLSYVVKMSRERSRTFSYKKLHNEWQKHFQMQLVAMKS